MTRRPDYVSLVSGIVTIALGTLLVLDQAGTIELTFAYLLPALTGAVGAVLLASGLAGGEG
jgi:hypothetical protein